MKKPQRYKDFQGEERTKLSESLAEQYAQGASVRQLANSIGRTYAFVHTMLEEAGTVFRSSAGASRTPDSLRGPHQAPPGMRRLYWDGVKNTVVPWNEGK